MRKLLPVVLASLLVLSLSGLAVAQDEDAAITSPDADEIVYQNTLELAAHDETAVDNDVQWAVRSGTCARSTGTVAGNVDGFSDDSNWVDGEFSAMLDISSWSAGQYCFVFNTQQGPADGHRLTQWFYIVDQYVKVGGTIGMGEAGPGNSPTHAFDGLVGNAGSAGVVGSITVNYRTLGEHRTFDASSLSFRSAPGIGVDDPNAVAEIGTEDGALILVLDRDASEDFPRGAIVVRAEGSPSDSPYEIDDTPGSTGADSWVGMERGNNHVGVR